MGADLLLIAAAEPSYHRVYEPVGMQFARFEDDVDRDTFRRFAVGGPPLAREDGALLNLVNLARRFHDGEVGTAPPPGIHYPDSQPRTPERPRVARSIRYLNGIYLAEFLGRHGLSVDVINHLEEDIDLAQASLERDPLAIGISSTHLPNREPLERIAAEAKRLRPDIPVIVGGPLAFTSYRLAENPVPWRDVMPGLRRAYFLLDEEGAETVPIDFFVCDVRGEETLLRLLSALKQGDDVSDIPNLAVRDQSGRYHLTRREPERYDPERHEVRWESVPDEHVGEAVSVAASSGCPYPCGYCNFDEFNTGIGVKPRDRVFAEMRHLEERGFVKRVYFTDDTMFPSRENMLEFCEGYRAAGLRISWGGFARIDVVEESDARTLGESGCSFLNFGIESGSPVIQQAMGKNLELASIPGVIAALNRAGVWTNSALIVGYPGETAETVDDTIALMNSYPTNERGVNFYAAYVFNAQPFSPVVDERDSRELRGIYYDWSHRTMDVVEAIRQHRRLDLGIHAAVLGYPGDVAGMGRFLTEDASSFERVYRIIRLRKELERAGEAGRRDDAARLLQTLGKTVRDAVAAREAVAAGVDDVSLPSA